MISNIFDIILGGMAGGGIVFILFVMMDLFEGKRR